MNKHSPKSDFLKARAVSLHRSGYLAVDVARMLHISKDTAYSWLDPEYRKRRAERGMEKTELRRQARLNLAEIRDAMLPTLPFVPHIKLTEKSKYTMRSV